MQRICDRLETRGARRPLRRVSARPRMAQRFKEERAQLVKKHIKSAGKKGNNQNGSAARNQTIKIPQIPHFTIPSHTGFQNQTTLCVSWVVRARRTRVSRLVDPYRILYFLVLPTPGPGPAVGACAMRY